MTSSVDQLHIIYDEVRFPFEDDVDYRSIKNQLEASISTLKTIKEQFKNEGKDAYDVIQLVIGLFEKRFVYHFYGDKKTNDTSKPEWFFTQTLSWINNNSEYFEEYIQKLFEEWELGESAVDFFGECLVKKVAEKIRSLLSSESFLENRSQFAHLLDETIAFSSEIKDLFGKESSIPEVMALFLEPKVMDEWIGLEKDAISVAVEAILVDEHGFDNRFEAFEDIDTLLVPQCADTFIILMQSMSERYFSLSDSSLRFRFLKHQLVIVDEFLNRLTNFFHECESPWKKPYPQLMNALWFIALVLDEWSKEDKFVELMAAETHKPTARLTFEESSDLYRHEWRKRAKYLVKEFRELITEAVLPYAAEKWFQMSHPKPLDVSSSLSNFIKEATSRIETLNSSISEDSRLSLFHLLNHEIWCCVAEDVVASTSFTARGAAQLLFDISTGLIPYLNVTFIPFKNSLKADSAQHHFDVAKNWKCAEVLNSLKILSLPAPTAILLKDELSRIPDSMIAEKLEPFGIGDIGRQRILALFEQRCDMNTLT